MRDPEQLPKQEGMRRRRVNKSWGGTKDTHENNKIRERQANHRIRHEVPGTSQSSDL